MHGHRSTAQHTHTHITQSSDGNEYNLRCYVKHLFVPFVSPFLLSDLQLFARSTMKMLKFVNGQKSAAGPWPTSTIHPHLIHTNDGRYQLIIITFSFHRVEQNWPAKCRCWASTCYMFTFHPNGLHCTSIDNDNDRPNFGLRTAAADGAATHSLCMRVERKMVMTTMGDSRLLTANCVPVMGMSTEHPPDKQLYLLFSFVVFFFTFKKTSEDICILMPQNPTFKTCHATFNPFVLSQTPKQNTFLSD